MRLHTVFLLMIVLGVATSNGFFIKKAAATLAGVKLNLVNDAKTAIGDLKESARLKAKAVTGGIKAIAHAKLGLVKGIKHAKIGVLKGIAAAKLAKLVALKAGKLAFAKTLIAAKLAPAVAVGIHSGAIKSAVSTLPSAQNFFQGLTNKLGATSSKLSLGNFFSSFGGSSSSFSSGNNLALFPSREILQGLKNQASSAASNLSIGNLFSNLGNVDGKNDGVENGNFAVFPSPSLDPAGINVVTYKSDDQSPSHSSGNHWYPSRQLGDSVPSTPVASYGTPLSLPSTSYGVPIRR